MPHAFHKAPSARARTGLQGDPSPTLASRHIYFLETWDRQCPVSMEGLGSDTAAFVSLGGLVACSDCGSLDRVSVLLVSIPGPTLYVLPLRSSVAPLHTPEGPASFMKAPSHHLAQHRQGENQGSDKDSNLRVSHCALLQGFWT